MEENRGSIAFATTYRPPVPLDIFSCPLEPKSKQDELHMSDGVFYNYNGQDIPSEALKTILKRPLLASQAKEADVDSGRLSGMIFVSERGNNLETLHIALRFNYMNPPQVKVFSFADVFDTFNGVRMEDTGSIAGDYLVYVSTMKPAPFRRQPWTAVYKTNLKTGETDRLTPSVYADLSPSVAPSGKKIAVASFQAKGGWDGEIEDLKTDIYVMNVEKPFKRRSVVSNGGWPTWGSDNVIFFHRKEGDNWGVFRVDISDGSISRVTPDGIHAMTPAAINATTVAVATIRKKYTEFSSDVPRVEEQYRHIEIFDSSTGRQKQITRKTLPKTDHFNPFVIDGGKRIGYHRCRSDLLKSEEDDIERKSHKLDCPHPDVGLFRISGVFPTFSQDGSKLAFVDNEFKFVWVADSKELRTVFEAPDSMEVFSPVWNQNPEKDILYVNVGSSFKAKDDLEIYEISKVSEGEYDRQQLTKGSNNAFPSTNPKGTRLVFRSTRNGGDKRHKNLYIMEDAKNGEYGGGKITRLTKGDWTDTHCQWSPSGNWIVFSSTRDKPDYAPETDNKLDPGYFAVFLVNPDDPSVRIRVNQDDLPKPVRVISSGIDFAGHVNHPFFSPDGKSIVITSDLAAVSADPISLPLFIHSVRPYGDIFTFDIDPDNIKKNKDVNKFNRITHSRYENSLATWTMFSTQDPNAAWNMILNEDDEFIPSCPYAHGDGGESWHMAGQLCIPKRCC